MTLNHLNLTVADPTENPAPTPQLNAPTRAFGRYASASRVMPNASPNPGASAR